MALDWRTNPARTYGELCKDVIALQGYKPGLVPIITRQEHPQEWRDWYAYYGFRRLYASQELMRAKDEKTVPTRSPFDFDADFNPLRDSPEVPSDRAHREIVITPEMRARQQAVYASFSGRKVEEAAPNRHKKSA